MSIPVGDIRDCVGVIGPVADFRMNLIENERSGISSWVESRQLEYSSGRHYAHLAMEALGIVPSGVGRRQDRSPIWPAGLVGSIAHCEDVAVAVVACEQACRGIGVDVELRGRVEQSLFDVLFTLEEKAKIELGTSPTLLFCAKEAIYKALNPLTGVFIEFTEVGLVIASDGGVAARYAGADTSVHQRIEGVRIQCELQPRHALALVTLP